jgi:hypothetical protein
LREKHAVRAAEAISEFFRVDVRVLRDEHLLGTGVLVEYLVDLSHVPPDKRGAAELFLFAWARGCDDCASKQL